MNKYDVLVRVIHGVLLWLTLMCICVYVTFVEGEANWIKLGTFTLPFIVWVQFW